MQRKYKIPNVINIDGWVWGKIAHSRRARIKPEMGATIKRFLLIRVGLFCSLVKSLIASANG